MDWIGFVDDFPIYCSGSTALEACQKINFVINAFADWTNSKG